MPILTEKRRLIINLKNFTFGQLRVREMIEESSDNSLCQCVCSCGNEIVVSAADLLSGEVFSCGCVQDPPVSQTKFIGQRWGRLTAVEHMGYDIKEWNGRKEKRSIWLFRCDCGTEKPMYLNNVRYSNVRSCGCLALENVRKLRTTDITGQQFGRLKAIRPTDQRTKNGSILWELSCRCGNLTYKTVNELKCGLVSSCGCLYQESRKYCSSQRKDYVNQTSISSLLAAKTPSVANKTGYTGVFYNKAKGKWQAYICYQRKTYQLGYFDDIAGAITARRDAEHFVHDPVVMSNWDILTEEQKQLFNQYMCKKSMKKTEAPQDVENQQYLGSQGTSTKGK